MLKPIRKALPLSAGLVFLHATPAFSEEKENSPFGSRLVRSISETDLPFTGGDSELDIEIKPKLGDVIDDPYIRLPIEFEYGFTPKLEGSVGFIPYLRNPFKSDSVQSDGYLTFGLKQRVDALRDDRLAVAVGFDARVPLERIPSDWVRDNYNTYTPYLAAAYEIDRSGEWTVFTNISHELLDKDHHQLEEPSGEIDSLSSITAGVLHHPPGDLRYGLRFHYLAEDFLGDDHDALQIIPSVTWYPPEGTPFFRSIAGHFELTLDLEYSVSKLPEQMDDSDFGVALDVRWNLLRKIRRPKYDVVH